MSNQINREITKLVTRYIKKLIRFLIRRPLSFVKRHFKGVLITYITSIFLVTPVMTTLTTQASFTKPMSVVNMVKEGGVSNALTLGLGQPIKNGVTYGIGVIEKELGERLDNTDLLDKGIIKKNVGKSWFDGGNDTVATVDDYEVDEDFDYNNYPEYYKSLGLADVDPSDFPKAGSYKYSNLDKLGRTGTARATITYESAKWGCEENHGKGSDECKRQQFKANANPSGWNGNKEVDIPGKNGKTYHGYFYNRSHLIGDALGGDAVVENAVTGTRPQNVGNVDNKGGMRYPEMLAENFMKNPTKEVIYYEAKPVYVGNELVPRYVIVSVMSSDKKINEKVQVFNNANGWVVDYMTGQYRPQ